MELCEEFPCEMTDNSVDDFGMINAFKKDRNTELHGTDCPCVICSECGNETPSESIYCMICGVRFNDKMIKDYEGHYER